VEGGDEGRAVSNISVALDEDLYKDPFDKYIYIYIDCILGALGFQ
jgi:hypothetical protein